MSKNETVTISKAELLRLRLEPLFHRHVITRGLFPEAAIDFAQRAALSGKFALDHEGKLIGDDWSAGAFLDDLARDPKQAHLFQQAPGARAKDDPRKSEVDRLEKMTPMQRLQYANERKFAEMAREEAHD